MSKFFFSWSILRALVVATRSQSSSYLYKLCVQRKRENFSIDLSCTRMLSHFESKTHFCLWTSFLCVASSTLSKHTIDHRSISLNLNYQLCFSLFFLLVPILVRWSYKKEEDVKYENQRRRFFPKKIIYSFLLCSEASLSIQLFSIKIFSW